MVGVGHMFCTAKLVRVHIFIVIMAARKNKLEKHWFRLVLSTVASSLNGQSPGCYSQYSGKYLSLADTCYVVRTAHVYEYWSPLTFHTDRR
jgi:hypothetical protein